jgi:hypothetical protein
VNADKSASAHPSAERVTEYDRQMAQVIITAINYLSTERGQRAINRLSRSDRELNYAVSVKAHHKIPWHNLTLPGWAEEREKAMPLVEATHV